MGDFIVLSVLTGIGIAIIRFLRRQQKKGGCTGCSHNCSGCAGGCCAKTE